MPPFSLALKESELPETDPGDEFAALKARVHDRFLQEADIASLISLPAPALAEQIRTVLTATVEAEGLALSLRGRTALTDAIISEIVGFGPLEPLLQDPTVTEIMVNGPHQVYIERSGRLFKTAIAFADNAHVLRIIERIVAPLGRRIDEASPMVDARLPDGSRVNAIIPPLTVGGPVLTIRKFAAQAYLPDDLIRFGTLTAPMAEFLRACVVGRLNILISGGTGSGKTTTLNALSAYIPSDERILTIEDAAELQLQQEHVIALESRPANLEGRGEISIRHLVRNALRMRPDRIIVGEVRGGETLDMLQAMNTGHDGSLSSAHANSPRDALARLETMALMAGTELPMRAIREQIASALQILIHQSRLRDGRRVVTHITEVQGMEGEIIVLQDIFRYVPHSLDQSISIQATGLRPHCLETLAAHGLVVAPEIFQERLH